MPYAGFKGDYQSTVVLTPTANGFPWLAQAGGRRSSTAAAGGTYTMVGADIPYFLMHLDHLSRRIRLEAFDAVSGKSWHRVSDDEYLTRNSTPGGFFAFTWDGTRSAARARTQPVVHRAERPVHGEGLGAESTGRREQPGALGDMDVAGDHDRPAVTATELDCQRRPPPARAGALFFRRRLVR